MNVKNRTIFTQDNLHILRGLESDTIDLIYLDPPFNSKHNYAAPIGSKAAGAAFKDTWTLDDIDMAWWGEIADVYPGLYKTLEATKKIAGRSMMSYLIYMAIRLIEMHRVLKDTGSLYLHCDPTASHYLKAALDAVFGSSSFRSEIIWERNRGRTKIKHQSGTVRSWGTQHDTIFFYGKKNNMLNVMYAKDISKKFPYEENDGRKFALSPATLSGSMGRRPNQEYEYNGYRPKYGWRFVRDTLERLDRDHFIYWNDRGTPYKKMYESDHPGKPISNIWDDIDASRGMERLGYPTQKPLALLERIIKASSNEGDMILDPFCGCATACSAAEKLNRQWIGIDISPKAYDLVKQRLKKEAGLDKFTKGAGKVIHRVDIPSRKGARTPCFKDVLYGRQKGKCAGCCHHFEYQHLEMDHIVPRAKGGSDADDNLQLLCSSCNRIKGSTRDMSELKARLKELGLDTCDRPSN